MTYTQNDIEQVANELITKATSRTLCFYGPMGAGKTTLIKSIVNALGGADAANSPTFGIVNEYHHTDGEILGYHFDCYRLEDETEVLDLGFDEYLDQDVWVFIEWPEKIKTFLPEDNFPIHIAIIDPLTREITL